MQYSKLKERALNLFDRDKLQQLPHEWGFFNETDRNIKRIGYATNISAAILAAAKEQNVDFFLTHHDSWDFIFGLKESCNQILQEADITHAFFHAPLDDADFGTSASLAKALGMYDCRKVMPYADVYFGGVTGVITPADFDHFSLRLKEILREEPRCFHNNDKKIRKIAVAAGGGNMTNEMRIAAEAGCDTYVTGEYVLYSQQYAEHVKMNLFVGSHTNTEILGVKSMAELLAANGDAELIRISEPAY